MKINITYIVSNIDKALAFEWVAEYLNKDRFNLTFILLNPSDSALERYLKLNGVKVERIDYKSKFDLPFAIVRLILYFLKNRIQVVHCHLFDACMAGLIASKIAFIKKRIFTRHYSTNHHDYYPKAVKYDRLINFLATDIIAISRNVEKVLIYKEDVPLHKIRLIHHGFNLIEFENVENIRIQKLIAKYNIPKNKIVFGVISRYVELKGIQYVIPAIASLPNKDDVFIILANCNGGYKNKIQSLLSQFFVKNQYVEIEFESDLPALYKLMDIFIHVPIDNTIEAFGQTYVEALASGIPSIFTLSGIANEFIKHEKNALVVEYKNFEDIASAINKLVQNEELRNKLIKNGKSDVQQFNIENFIFKLESLYLT